MIMKKLSNLSKLMLLLILLFCSTSQSIAQFRRNHLKTNLMPLVVSKIRTYELGYEYRLNNHWSLEGSLGLIRTKQYSPSRSTTVGTFQYEDEGGNILFFPLFLLFGGEKPYYETYVWDNNKKNGGLIRLGTRWYAQSSIKKPQQGFYIGVNLLYYTYVFEQYRYVFRREPMTVNSSLNFSQKVTETVSHERLQQNAFGGKIDVGWQWVIKKKLALDVYLDFGAENRTYPQESLSFNSPYIGFI